MSESKQLRLGQIARKLNVGRNTIIDFLRNKGYEIDSNPNTKINSEGFNIYDNGKKIKFYGNSVIILKWNILFIF